MGVVYRAHDERLDRDVALKVLPAGTLGDDTARKRLRREAFALARLNHPHIEAVYDFDSEGTVDFLVMEHVTGPTLADRLMSGALDEPEVLRLGQQLASALEEAHGLGVVHRDLKPANIKVAPKGQVTVLDFGLAALLEAKVKTAPDDARFHGSLGIAYAGLGRKAEAMREGQQALQLMPVSKDAYRGPFHVEEMARIYAMVGERDAAVEQLEHLMSIPFDLGPAGLGLDPTWDSLRDHPRFQKLVSR